MKTENKYSILVWSVVILVVLNISTVATILYQKHSAQNQGSADQNNNFSGRDRQDSFSGRYFRGKLNLTPEQLQEFQKFNPEFRNKAREINMQLYDLRNRMLQEMAVEKNDTAELNAISDSIGKLHGDLKKLTYRYYLDLKHICMPEQYPMLEDIFTETFNDGFSRGQGGRMMRNRERYRGGRN
jgi:Spy/CpxP family protein refolding chaperone